MFRIYGPLPIEGQSRHEQPESYGKGYQYPRGYHSVQPFFLAWM